MHKLLLTFVSLLLLSSSVFAESATELCMAEAKDAGIEDAIELNAYVNDCVAQMNADAAESQTNSDSQTTDNN